MLFFMDFHILDQMNPSNKLLAFNILISRLSGVIFDACDTMFSAMARSCAEPFENWAGNWLFFVPLNVAISDFNDDASVSSQI